MPDTTNVTMTVNATLLARAKLVAIKAGTSVQALLQAELEHLVSTFEAAESSQNENFGVLLDFALGRLDDQVVMDRLGIDSHEDLFLLMVAAHLPMPRLPEAFTQEMLDNVSALMASNGQR